MRKRTNHTDDMQDLLMAGDLIEKAQKNELTIEEKAKIKEVIWTIACKDIINSLLTDLPMQQKELAKAINVSPSMITEYKKGTKLPSLPTTFLLLSVLRPEMLDTITNGANKDVNELLKTLGINFEL